MLFSVQEFASEGESQQSLFQGDFFLQSQICSDPLKESVLLDRNDNNQITSFCSRNLVSFPRIYVFVLIRGSWLYGYLHLLLHLVNFITFAHLAEFDFVYYLNQHLRLLHLGPCTWSRLLEFGSTFQDQASVSS